jgi:2,3-diketo-5-methylthio-1-phosphopentane phosphatase
MEKPARYKNLAVFFDFDNTITTHDVFDDMLTRFSINDNWVDLEKKWKDGKIGSRECMAGQLEGIRISKNRLDGYLKKVRIDPYFKRLLRFFDVGCAKVIVLSDNFDYILNRVLEHNGVKGLEVYANAARFADDKLIPGFPFESGSCRVCAHCKKENLLMKIEHGSKTIYIGDGLSDACPAEFADMVFAKGYLSEHLGRKGVPFALFETLKDVYGYFKKRSLSPLEGTRENEKQAELVRA